MRIIPNTKKSGITFLEIVLSALAIVVMSVLLCKAYEYFLKASYPQKYHEIVMENSQKYRLDPELVYAVIRTESGFNPDAQSDIPARGLMQITQDTFEWAQFRIEEEDELHFDDLYDPTVNIQYGAAILRLLLDEFGSVENALCAYHQGWGTAKKWLEDPEVSPDGRNIEYIPSNVTKRYVDKVLNTQKLYDNLYNAENRLLLILL